MSEVNSALTRAIKGDQFQPGSNFEAYINTIIRNSAINLKRKGLQVNIMSDVDDMHETYEYNVSYQPSLESKELLQSINKDLDKWLKKKDSYKRGSKKWAQLYQAHFVDGLKYEECAAYLDIPIGTIKTRIHNIREYVKEKYGNLYKSA